MSSKPSFNAIRSPQEQRLIENQSCYGYATTEGGLNPPPWLVRNTLLSLWDELLRRTRIAKAQADVRHGAVAHTSGREKTEPDDDGASLSAPDCDVLCGPSPPELLQVGSESTSATRIVVKCEEGYQIMPYDEAWPMIKEGRKPSAE